MSVGLYMDVHVPRDITLELRRRGVDVLTAQEDSSQHLPDPELLSRATELNRVLFSQDKHFLGIAANRQAGGEPFAGVLYAHQLRVTLGQCIADLELIGLAGREDEFRNKLEYLPLSAFGKTAG